MVTKATSWSEVTDSVILGDLCNLSPGQWGSHDLLFITHILPMTFNKNTQNKILALVKTLLGICMQQAELVGARQTVLPSELSLN